MSGDLRSALERAVGADRVWQDLELASMTTFKVGGPADWLVEPRSAGEIREVLAIARRERLPVTVIGGGSNLVVADNGVRGIVLRPRGGEIVLVAPDRVRAAAAVTINGLVRWTVSHALAGLELWAGTPGTVGGAVYGNAHFKGQLIGDLVACAAVVAPDGSVSELSHDDMEFGYDTSRLQRTREILLWAEFRVAAGDPDALRRIARESLAYRKVTQPLNVPSAGCIFQNPDPAKDLLPAGVPASAGALIDRAGLKGHRVGGARVSPTHGNFIVNDRGATAADIRQLVEECKRVVRREFGVDLKEEIVYLGEF
ncbi:MAG TPA: UDP-N-acetylmuramate dehydrogenase [Vicinamibacterales bacterium]|nr:UDP-N-acetylmuramate dehydrogenase [Vicinamibacterales bacterium]